MSDTPIPTPEKSAFTKDPALCRLKTLVYISLSLNTLILLLIFIGVVTHHRDERRQMANRDRDGGRYEDRGPRDYGPRFSRFEDEGRGRDWGHRGDWGRPRFADDGPRDRDFGPPPGPRPGPFGPPPDPAKMTDGILRRLTDKLTLSDDQKAKIKPIIADQVAQIQKEMEAQRAAIKSEIEDAKAKIKPLLNADQQKDLDALPIPGDRPEPPPKPEGE